MSDHRPVLRRWASLELEGRSASIVPFLEAVAADWERPKLKLPPDDEPMKPAVVTGRCQGVPVKVEIDEGACAQVIVKASTSRDYVAFWFDPTATERRPDPDDDWADEETLRVLVAPGVLVEGDEETVDRALAFLRQLGEADSRALIEAMIELRLRKVELFFEEVSAYDVAALGEVDDPVGRVGRLVQLALWINQLGGAERPVRSGLRRERCSYCGARYFFGVYQERCPGCGAPPGA